MKMIPEFKTEPQRQQWFVENGDYFTAVVRKHNRNIKMPFHTKVEAVTYAQQELSKDPLSRPFMIYAVVGHSDSFVENVYHKV